MRKVTINANLVREELRMHVSAKNAKPQWTPEIPPSDAYKQGCMYREEGMQLLLYRHQNA
jgi:hypothetical protein